MAKMDKYGHGDFSWVDLGTTDANAAKKFYGDLFGWEFEDEPAGPGMTYAMAKLGGETVCALYTMGKDMQGIPPHWLSYVTVDDADAIAKKATANGGTIMKQPFDVMSFGRMALLTDPSGAALAVWQPKEHAGASVRQDPGTLCWTELYTTNVDAAGKFYVSTFGWSTTPHDLGPMGTYTLFGRDGKKDNVGGMMNMPPDMKSAPSHWLPYFATSDVDSSTRKAEALGGKTIMPAIDIPNIGRFSVVQDPQGAVFALYKNAH